MYDMIEIKTPGKPDKLVVDLQRGFGSDPETNVGLILLDRELYCLRPTYVECGPGKDKKLIWELEPPKVKRWSEDLFLNENVELLKSFVAGVLEQRLTDIKSDYIDDITNDVCKTIHKFFFSKPLERNVDYDI